MEIFILKVVGMICVSLISLAIVITRKDDLSLWAVCIAIIFELLSIIIIFLGENLMNFIMLNLI